MKKIIRKTVLLCLLAMFTVACGNNTSKKTAENAATKAQTTVKSYTVNELLNDAPNLVGQEVVVRAFINHTCKHSGRRCFVSSADDANTTLRIEAGGKIGGFNRELLGSEALLTGILMERRLTKEYLAQYAEELNEKKAEDGSAESCESELKNVQSIMAKLKEDGKDYHSTYYMNGTEYEVIED